MVLLVSLVGLLVGQLGASAGPLDPASRLSPEHSVASQAALNWLTKQLEDNGGSMPGFTPDSSDWGLTADVVLALVLGGRGSEPSVGTALDLLSDNADLYTTWAPTMPEVREAGPTAKALLALLSGGRSSTLNGVNLETELRSLMVPTGSSAGRFSDRTPDPSWDASNGFGQAFAMLSLSLTTGGVPVQAAEFLLAQQCPSGGFPLSYTTGGCANDNAADTDAAAMAIQALLVTDRTPRVLTALERGVGWLESKQDSSGGFEGTGPTAGVNTNSTGLIAQALRGAGRTEAADQGASWIIATAQLDTAMVAGTPASGNEGAIGYNAAAADAALSDGITAQVGDQWRRSTAQAVMALGLPTYGGHNLEPMPPSSSTSTSSTSTTSVPTIPATSVPTTSVPTVRPLGIDPPANKPTDMTANEATQVPGNESSTQGALISGRRTGSNKSPNDAASQGSRGPTTLPRTGSETLRILALGGVLLVGGVAALCARAKAPVQS